MDNNFIKNLLTDIDDSLLRESVDEFDAPFDNEALFQRSFSKFQRTSKKRKAFYKHSAFRTVTAVACLLLTVGLGVNVWSKHQRIETKLPPETPSTIQTETRTETTVQATTESQTNLKNKETTRRMPETTVRQPEDVAAIHTTAIYTTAVTVQELVSTDIKTAQKTAAVTTVMSTASTLKSQTYSVQTNLIPRTPAITSPSITTGVAVTTDLNQSSNTANPVASTETAVTTLTPQSTSAPNNELATAISTTVTTTIKKDDFPDLEGYHIQWDSLETNQWRVSYTETVNASPSERRTYEINSPDYQIIQEDTSDEASFRQYHVQCTGQAKSFWLRQYSRDEFSFMCPSGSSLEAASISGNPCVWVFSHDAYTLWWDNGCYMFCVFGEASDRDRMEEVAECFM